MHYKHCSQKTITTRHGIEVGDEILAPRNTTTTGRKCPQVYNLFVKFAKQTRPLLFEVKRSPNRIYKQINSLPGCYSLHWFIINKLGNLGMLLEEENLTLRLKSVLPNCRGDFYGLRNGDILCKPFTNEELEQNDKTLRKT